MYMCLMKVSTFWLIEKESFPTVGIIVFEVLFHAKKTLLS